MSHPDEGFYLAAFHIRCALHKGLVALSANIDGQLKVLSHRQNFGHVLVVYQCLDLILVPFNQTIQLVQSRLGD